MKKHDITESERAKIIKELTIEDFIGDQEKKSNKNEPIKTILTNFNPADFDLDDTKQKDSTTKKNVIDQTK